MTRAKLLTAVRLVVLGIALLLLLLGHAIPGWFNIIEKVEDENIMWNPYPHLSRRRGLWFTDACIDNNTQCSLYALPRLGQSLGVDWAHRFAKAWIPIQVIAVLVLVLCMSMMIRTVWELRKTPSLSKHDLIAFFAILLAGFIGSTIVLSIAIEQIGSANERWRYIYYFPFAFFAFALGCFLIIAASVILSIEIVLKIRSSFNKDTALQQQEELPLQISIPRSLRYVSTASKVVLPIALVLLVLGIVTPRWKAYQDEKNILFQLGIWYRIVCDRCRNKYWDLEFLECKVFTLIATVLTLLSVVVVMVPTAWKQRHALIACILVSFSLTLASVSLSAWTAGYSIESHVMNKHWNHVTLMFPYSLFLFSFGTGLNVLIAIYQAVILFRVWPSVTTHRDVDTVPIQDNNLLELPDIHENINDIE